MKKVLLLFTIVLTITMQSYAQDEAINGKLDVTYATGNGTISNRAIRARRYTTTTTNVTSYDKAIWGELVDYDIPASIKDSGYKIGVEGSSFANNISNFAGTLTGAYGVWARSGIYRAAPGARIEKAIAVYADILSSQANTSIDNAYGILINNGSGATNITNNYGVYQATLSAKNYFAGNVGVGTNNPANWFSGKVLELADSRPILKLDASGSLGTMVFTNNGVNASSHHGEFHLNHYFNSSNHSKSQLQFGSYPGGNVMVVQSDGKVGIGKDNPSYELDVVGVMSMEGSSMETPFKIWTGGTGSVNHMRIGTDFGHYGDAVVELYQNYAGGSSQNPGKLIVNGNLGIGTTAPTEKLTVNGKINAEEIILEDVDGADFVFEEDYDLRSLEETEQFIKANKHLPEIPSAAEMADEGLELKEINILLLQKVEELTLHLIDQNKQIQGQEERIEKLEKVNSALLKKLANQ